MSERLVSGHPIQRLLFFVAQDIEEGVPAGLKRELEDISRSRTWVIAPPEFLDEVIESELGTPVRTVGGILQVYSARPPLSLPRALDAAHLEEVEYLAARLRQFSEREDLAIEFELDGVFVGSIEDGKIDRALREGLLAEWRRTLENSSQ